MNLDTLKRFPNQNSEHRPFECTAETTADLLGNIFDQPLDPGYNYGATFRLTGQQPSDSGLDPFAAFAAPCVYGCLPTEDEPFDATTTSELMEANFNAYSLQYKQLAANFAPKGVVTLNGYDAVIDFMNRARWGAGIAMKWYDSFAIPNQDGSLPAPVGNFTYHEVAVYEATPLGLRIKPWLGQGYGAGGYAFLSRITYGLVVQNAQGFDPNAWQWLSRVKIALQYPKAISDILPLLYASKS